MLDRQIDTDARQTGIDTDARQTETILTVQRHAKAETHIFGRTYE